MKVQSHTLRNADGGGWDQFLFGPLRNRPDEPAMMRVDEILSLLVAADSHLREQLGYLHRSDPRRNSRVGVPEFLDLHGRSKESERAYQQTLELLNKKLSRYRWEAILTGDISGFRSELHPIGGSKGEWELVEPFMVAALLKVMDKPGEISRFRRCSDCQQWFYATRGHQHFCGDVCRRRHEAQNPAFKEKRRIYMREKYRPLQKELQERSVRVAKAPRQKQGKG
jgi:hypothetical protein